MRKKSLEAIALNRLRNNLHSEITRSFLALLQGEDIDTKYIDDLVIRFKALSADEDSALEQVARYDTTGKIHEEDHRRDTAFYGSREMIRTYARHFDEDKRAAAARLDTIFEDYKTAPHKALPDESNEISILLQRLENYNDDINLLGLGDWINELRQGNNNVRSLSAERESEAASRAHFKVKTIRVDVDQVCYEIFGRLEAAATLEGVEAYQSLFNEINARITEYNNLLAREKGRRNSKKAGEGEQTA
jgi:hypothetical protein